MSDVEIVVGIKADASGGRVIKKTLDDIVPAADKAIGSTGRLEKAFSSVRTASIGLSGALVGLVSAFGLRELGRISDQYTMLGARLKNITGSTNQAAFAMKELQRISAETGTSIGASLDIMQRLSFVQKEIGVTNNEMIAFTETVSKLGVMSGASSDALKFGLTQLGQSLSSNVMRAEEFNSIMENIPAVGKAIADGLGVSTGQLRLLVNQGVVLREDILAAVLNQTNAVNAAMADMPKTIERAGKEAGITFDTLVAKIMNTTDAGQGYVNIIEFGNDRLKEMVATVDIIRQSFEFMGNRVAVTFNNIAYEIQNLYNKASVAISDMTGGQINPGIKSDIFKLGYGQTLDQFNTGKANAVRSAMGDKYGPAQPQQTRDISKDYADIASKLSTVNKLTAEQKKAASEAAKSQKKIQGDLKDAVKDSRTETEKLYDAIAEQEKLKPFAKTSEQAKAISINIKNAQKELAELAAKAELKSPVGQAFSALAKEIDGDFKDAFKSMFTETEGGFKKMIAGLKATFKNFLAELVYQAAVRPIVVSLVGGVGGALGLSGNAVASGLGLSGARGMAGGGMSGGIGSIGSLLSSAGNLLSGGTSTLLTSGVNRLGSLLGIGGVGANGPVSLSSYSSLTNGSFGGSLGAGLGGLGGNLLANSLLGGNRGIGSSIGGAIGGVAGSFIPVPIAGPLIGSFIGNAIGGLFGGKKPSDRSQSGTIDFATLAQSTSGLGGKKYSPQNAASRDAILGQISGVLGLVGKYGGTATGSASVTIGNRDGLRYNGQNFGQNSSAFSNAIFTDLRKSITGLDKTFSTILDKLGVGNSLDTLTRGFEFGQQYNDTLAGPKSVATQLSDAIKVLDDNMAGLIVTASSLGLPIDEYTKALQKQKEVAVGALKAQAAGFNSLADMTKAFDSFFNGQALGSNSSLTPMQKLQTAQATFGDLLTKAQGGDLSVTSDLLGSANTLLDQGRNVYASGVDFSNLEGFVRSSVKGVAGQAGYEGQNVAYSIVSTNQQLVTQGADQTQAIQEMKAEIYRLSNKIAVLTDKVA